jgi:predicted phage-related endonuclease
MAAAMNYLANGKEGADRKKLKSEILAERMTDIIVPHYVTPQMKHGIDYEPEAKAAFVRATGVGIKDCGFIEHMSIEDFGASPDALTDDGGVLETKCPTTQTHMAYLMARVMPAEYKPQVLSQLSCTGRKHAWFASFDPRIKDERLRLFVIKWEPPREEIDAIEAAAIEFLGEVESMFQQLTTMEIE